jgi:hypothetical protein
MIWNAAEVALSELTAVGKRRNWIVTLATLLQFSDGERSQINLGLVSIPAKALLHNSPPPLSSLNTLVDIMPVTLPYELRSRILKESLIGLSRIDGLKACALLQRSWTRKAQRLLFQDYPVRIGAPQDPNNINDRSIQSLDYSGIDDQGHDASISKFLAMISQSPHIADLIRTIYINITGMCRPCYELRHNQYRYRKKPKPYHQHPCQWSCEELLAAVLQAPMTHLEIISLFVNLVESEEKRSAGVPCAIFPHPTDRSMEMLRPALATVRRLELIGPAPITFQSLDSCIRFISSFISLNDLVIEYINILDSPAPDDALSGSSGPVLKQLTLLNIKDAHSYSRLKGHKAIIGWLQRIGALTVLQHLCIGLWDDYFVDLHRALGARTQLWSMEISDTINCELLAMASGIDLGILSDDPSLQ